MRPITTAQSPLPTSTNFGVRARVHIKDALGTFIDLTSLAGRDWFQTVNWGEEVDATTLTCDVTLARDMAELSLAPLMSASGLNHAMDPSQPFRPLLQPTRQVKVEVSIVPMGKEPVEADWMLVFEGYVDNVDWADHSVKLACSDKSAKLRDCVIEVEKIYSHTSNTTLNGLRPYQVSTAFALNELVLPDPNRTGRFYKCTKAGTSDVIGPVWPTTVGQSVDNGGCTFQCVGNTVEVGMNLEQVLQSMLNDHAHQPTTLFTPVSSPTALKFFHQPRAMLYGELVKLAQQIGWTLRYKWRQATGQFELTLYEPIRTDTSVDYVFSPDNVLEVSTAAQSIENVRNVCVVNYLDKNALGFDGRATRQKVTATNSGSVNLFGRRYMEIQEADTSVIDNATSANTLANAALNDLSTPLLEHSVKVRLFPWAELGDLYTFEANGIHYDSDQTLAVNSIKHTVGPNGAFTDLGLRGKPAGAYLKWIERAATPPKSNYYTLAGNFNLQLISMFRGTIAVASYTNNPQWRIPDNFEFHVSQTPDFVPSIATLRQRSRATELNIGNLTPGGTYYVRAIPYLIDTLGNEVRGAPSPASSVVAGFIEAADIRPGVIPPATNPPSEKPLNGSFEFGAGPPDNWSMKTGTWGSGITLDDTSAGDGTRSVQFTASSLQPQLRSDFFPVNGRLEYEVRTLWQGQPNTLSRVVFYGIEFYDSNKGALSGGSQPNVNINTFQGPIWNERSFFIRAPDNAAYARIVVGKESQESDFIARVDGITVIERSNYTELLPTPIVKPFNAAFGQATRLAGSGASGDGPDGWTFNPPVGYGNGAVLETANHETGLRCIRFFGTTNYQTPVYADSPRFPVSAGSVISEAVRLRTTQSGTLTGQAVSNGLYLEVRTYDVNGTYLSSPAGWLVNTSGSWQTVTVPNSTIPANARFASIRVAKGMTSSYDIYIQSAQFLEPSVIKDPTIHGSVQGNLAITGNLTTGQDVYVEGWHTGGTQQTFGNATFDIIDFNNITTDTHATITRGGADVWVFKAPSGGRYLFQTQINFVGVPAGTGIDILLAIFRNGTEFRRFARMSVTQQSGPMGIWGSTVINITSTADKWAFRVYQASGATRQLESGGGGAHEQFTITKLAG